MANLLKSTTSESASGLKRIFVAPDLTVYTDRASDRAVMLAQDHQASLRLLNLAMTTPDGLEFAPIISTSGRE
ncbi:MAG: hypothetical protein AAFO01_17325 [Pseudomonadota bacterium]